MPFAVEVHTKALAQPSCLRIMTLATGLLRVNPFKRKIIMCDKRDNSLHITPLSAGSCAATKTVQVALDSGEGRRGSKMGGAITIPFSSTGPAAELSKIKVKESKLVMNRGCD